MLLESKKERLFEGKIERNRNQFSKNKPIRDLCNGIRDFKKLYQATINVIKNENEK